MSRAKTNEFSLRRHSKSYSLKLKQKNAMIELGWACVTTDTIAFSIRNDVPKSTINQVPLPLQEKITLRVTLIDGLGINTIDR